MYAQFVLFDGFDPLDVIAPYEVLIAASMVTGGAITPEFVTAEGAREVPSGIAQLSLRAVGQLDPVRADIIVLPGMPGGLPDGTEGGATNSDVTEVLGRVTPGLAAPLTEALGRDDTLVATVCGGSLILAKAGLLQGRPAATHHAAMVMLAAFGAIAVPARVVDDGDLITGGGVTSGLDVALYLVEREIGPQVAHTIEQLFAYERRGVVWSQRERVSA
ncbi:DJ-1/PfpI family protein [Nocardia iowensis]|uniref:DJ-1/PfpI family protein n=1 Tax=Nocardia iowensis TaxID=204891 RepID=A0ABX8RGH3_NOCIO|nr:DJ-1/PfpI family protein [Nocardia iowensis]QXN88690.1 DJ-1/PfpI family protein [Nocardia iowensis]